MSNLNFLFQTSCAGESEFYSFVQNDIDGSAVNLSKYKYD